MFVVNWLLARKVEFVGYMDSTNMDSTIVGWKNAVNWLLARKVEFVGYMDSTIAGWIVNGWLHGQ